MRLPNLRQALVLSSLNCSHSIYYTTLSSVVKNLPAYTGDTSSILGLGRSPGGGNGHPLLYSCLENPMDRGIWWATVRGVAENWTQLSMQAQAGECIHMLRGWDTPLPWEQKSMHSGPFRTLPLPHLTIHLISLK